MAASASGLGPLVMATKGGNPFGGFVFGIVVAGLLLGAVLGVGSLGLSVGSWVVTILRPLLFVALVASLLWVFGSLVTLLTGFQRFYLYAGGLVRWRNGRVRVLAWPDVAVVKRVEAFGRRSGYQLNPVGKGRPVVLEAVQGQEDGDEMARRLEEVLHATGRQVTA
jgi:hypothetical protein